MKSSAEKLKRKRYKYNLKYRIKSLIASIKMTSCCQDCGGKDNLTFDHILKTGVVKFFDIADANKYTLGQVNQELMKCEIVCRSCHDKRESARRRTRVDTRELEFGGHQHEQVSSSAIYCEHANEVPAMCICDPWCYCKNNTCVN